MHLGGVDDDHVVAGVDVGGEDRLVLAPQHPGDLGGQAAEDGAVGVDLEPDTLDVGRLGGEGAHVGVLGVGEAGKTSEPGPRTTRVPAEVPGSGARRAPVAIGLSGPDRARAPGGQRCPPSRSTERFAASAVPSRRALPPA